MSTRELETGLSTLRFSRRLAIGLLDGIPEEHWLAVPLPGGNHATWIAGHLAWEDDDTLAGLVEGRGRKVPGAWHDRFAQGTKPTANANDYPGIADIRSALGAYREELLAFFTSRGDRLADPLPAGVHGMAKDFGALMPALACHEMLHVGQLTVVRKSLNLPPVFG